MKIDLEFVELHSGLFLNGINFGTKLTPEFKGGMELYYDTELKHTVVIHKDKVAILDTVASKTLKDPAQLGIDIVKVTPPTVFGNVPVMHANIKAQASGPEKVIRTAQVSTPMDKIQGKPVKRAKFQGEESQGE